MWKEFKAFITKGNVFDLAVAVVIGAAFGAVIKSLVNDIIMPIIGYLTAGVDFAAFKVVLIEASSDGAVAEVAITYGQLINVIIQFLIIALTIFLLVKAVSRFKKKEEAAKPTPADIVLLEEIRDLLKAKNDQP